MKKILTFILILITLISFTGCKKKNKNEIGEVDSHFSGFYVELVVDKDYKIKSTNPTSVYSFRTNLLSNDSGNIMNMGVVKFGESSKNVKEIDGVKTAIIMTSIILPANAPDKVKIYIVRENRNGTFTVDLDRYETIDVSNRGTYSVNYSYSIDGVKYRFQASLGYMKN